MGPLVFSHMAKYLSVILLLLLGSLALCISHASAQTKDERFTITFDNFTPRQVNQIMVYATRFKGYEQYELLSQRSKDTKMHYQSDIERPLLSHNFAQAFDDLNWEVISQQQDNQYHFTFVRIKPVPVPYGVW